MSVKRNETLPETNLAAAYLRERHDVRYLARIAIEVSGIHRNCELFHELTFTRDVGSWGCTFPLSLELKPDDIFAVRVLGGDRREAGPQPQSLFQVLRATREGQGWIIAAWHLEDRDLWTAELKNTEPYKGRRESRKHRL
jgi:hypothetical protein